MMRTIMIMILFLALAAPATAAKIKTDKDGTTEMGLEARPTNSQGQPIGPWKALPDSAIGPTNGPFARVRSQQAAQGCATVRAYAKRTSPAGFFLWQYFHYANFCWNYPNVTSVSRYTDHLQGNGWKYDGQNSSIGQFYTWCCNAAKSGHTRWFRGHFHVDVPLGGLFQSADPQITLKVVGNGQSFASFAGL